MKRILSLVLCLMMVLSLAAVAHADDKVTINFYCNPSKNGGVEAAVAAFEAANPGIHVEIVEFSSDTNQKKTTLSSIFQAQAPGPMNSSAPAGCCLWTVCTPKKSWPSSSPASWISALARTAPCMPFLNT